MYYQSDNFQQKNGIAVTVIARDLFIAEVGDRIATIMEYSERLNMGRGTIQNALALLISSGAVDFVKQGHKGTLITKLNKKILWKYTNWEPLIGAFPFPSSETSLALAEAFQDVVKRSSLEVMPSFTVAMHNRIQALNEGKYAFAVATQLIEGLCREQYRNVTVALRMPSCKYAGKYMVFQRKGEVSCMRDGAVLAINARSLEQRIISAHLCESVAFHVLEITQRDALHALAEGEVDCILCREDEAKRLIPRYEPNLSFEGHSISYLGLDEEIRIPVLMVNKNNYRIAELLASCIDQEEVGEIQKRVLAGEVHLPLF